MKKVKVNRLFFNFCVDYIKDINETDPKDLVLSEFNFTNEEIIKIKTNNLNNVDCLEILDKKFSEKIVE